MAEICDLCRGHTLEPVYWPERSGRDTVVHLCRHCGLVQSLPRGNSTDIAQPVPADRRQTARATASMKLLRAHTDLSAPLAVLDAGMGGEAFARALAENAPAARITAAPIGGATAAADASFDIIHSARTIERLRSPSAVLTQYWRALRPGGLLIVDAPSIAAITREEIAEEWFTETNRYHFSPVTLGRMLDAAGFDIIGGPDPMDRDHLSFAAVKRTVAHRPVPQDAGEVQRAGALIAAYSTARAKNLVAISAVAAELRRMAPRKIAVWGAGKLFDAVVTQGGFDPRTLALLVDGHLSSHASERHGIALNRPESLKTASVGTIVVMSRTFAREISRMAKRLAPKAEIVLYEDLIAQARVALAA